MGVLEASAEISHIHPHHHNYLRQPITLYIIRTQAAEQHRASHHGTIILTILSFLLVMSFIGSVYKLLRVLSLQWNQAERLFLKLMCLD